MDASAWRNCLHSLPLHRHRQILRCLTSWSRMHWCLVKMVMQQPLKCLPAAVMSAAKMTKRNDLSASYHCVCVTFASDVLSATFPLKWLCFSSDVCYRYNYILPYLFHEILEIKAVSSLRWSTVLMCLTLALISAFCYDKIQVSLVLFIFLTCNWKSEKNQRKIRIICVWCTCTVCDWWLKKRVVSYKPVCIQACLA